MSEKTRPRFEEIDVERINIVDADGKVRMAISGRDRFPGWVVRGKEFPGRPKHAGIIFYNDDGEECGGLVFGNWGIGLMFDQRDQDQIIGLMYSEENGSRWYGLNIWDRPDRPNGGTPPCYSLYAGWSREGRIDAGVREGLSLSAQAFRWPREDPGKE